MTRFPWPCCCDSYRPLSFLSFFLPSCISFLSIFPTHLFGDTASPQWKGSLTELSWRESNCGVNRSLVIAPSRRPTVSCWPWSLREREKQQWKKEGSILRGYTRVSMMGRGRTAGGLAEYCCTNTVALTASGRSSACSRSSACLSSLVLHVDRGLFRPCWALYAE